MNAILKYKFIILAAIVGMFSVLSLSNPGLPPTHDGEYHVLRFQQFHKALREETLYPRWAEDFNNGYGIPLFNYVYPLPNYFAAVVHFTGVSFIDAFKLNLATATIIGAVFMYLFASRFFGNIGGLVSAAFYSFSPYHLLDIYVRGSVGEVWSLGLAPGLLWAYTKFFYTKKITYFSLSVILLALLVFAHNILALVFFLFFLTYCGFLIFTDKSKMRSKKNIRDIGLIIALGLGISSIFWLSAIAETGYVRGLAVIDPTQHFPKIYKLIYSSWGYGFSGENVVDQMSFQVGIANIAAVAVALIVTVFIKNKKIIIFFLFSFFVTLFLITPFSKAVWLYAPLISYIQFPWRFLSLVILLTSFLAGLLASDTLIKNRQKKVIVGFLLIFICAVLGKDYAKAPFYHQRDDSYYLSRSNFTYGTNSPGNSFNAVGFNASLKKADSRLMAKNAKINILSSKSSYVKAIVKSSQKGAVLVNIAYFPDWQVLIDGKKTPITVNKDGLFEFEITKGTALIEVELRNTPIRLASVIITISSLAILFGLFVRGKYIKIKE